MTLTDRFWAWAATHRDRLVTNALEPDPQPPTRPVPDVEGALAAAARVRQQQRR